MRVEGERENWKCFKFSKGERSEEGWKQSVKITMDVRVVRRYSVLAACMHSLKTTEYFSTQRDHYSSLTTQLCFTSIPRAVKIPHSPSESTWSDLLKVGVPSTFVELLGRILYLIILGKSVKRHSCSNLYAIWIRIQCNDSWCSNHSTGSEVLHLQFFYSTILYTHSIFGKYLSTQLPYSVKCNIVYHE